MAEPIRKTHTVLMDNSTMADEIDRVIEAGVKSRLPVYIYIPIDAVGVPVDASRLNTPLNLEVKNPSPEIEEEIISSTLDLIKKSSNPAILADVLTIRHCGKELVKQLAELTRFPVYSTPLSKGVVDETSDLFNGLYNGSSTSRSALTWNLTDAIKSPFLVLLKN